MDSNEQNNIGVVLKISLCLIMTTLIIIMFIGVNNKIHINKNNVKAVFNENVGEKDITEKNIEDKENADDIVNAFKEAINNTFNIKINGYAISIYDKTYGYVSSIEERYSILNDVCKNYIKELGLNIEDILEVSIAGKIEATPYKVHISELNQSGEIANEIYDASLINDDLLGLQMKVKVSEEVDVEPSVVIEPTEELYMGQYERKEGTKGKSILYKELTYNGLVKGQENQINEEIIKPVVATVIKKGTKNPYYDGIAFLSRPTKGGYITSEYGEERSSSRHSGVDIAKDLGEAVTAAFDGEVVKAEYNNGGYGNLIVLKHENDMETYYAHLSGIYVSKGDIVKKGDNIGAIGSTGYSTGPHLHFELRVNGNTVNPMNYIEQE